MLAFFSTNRIDKYWRWLAFASLFFMENKKYKLKESVDVYTFNTENSDKTTIQFYKINTREKVTIEINSIFLEILSTLDGKKTLRSIFYEKNYHYDKDDLLELFGFLIKKGIIIEVSETTIINKYDYERYSRQINYFDDLLPEKKAELSQKELSNKKIVIIGCGATGGIIAEQLVRMGIRKLILIDHKEINNNHFSRHIYSDSKSIKLDKITALKKHLQKIDHRVEVNTLKEKIRPDSNLDNLIPMDTDLVVNTADEPYIGHISIKLGRYLWSKNIGLYISGGFDAHLMSSGELIFKGLTPCIDCCSNTFRNALKDWKPKYNHNSKIKITSKKESNQVVIGGSGGVFPQALYSSSLASMNIVDFLLGNNKGSNKINKRGEFLIEHCEHTWFEMKKQEGCNYCG